MVSCRYYETILESIAAARTLLFRVAGKTYGCDIDAVREIIPYRRATRLPGAPSFVQGLINLRGTIVTVLDLGTRLEQISRDANLARDASHAVGDQRIHFGSSFNRIHIHESGKS